jgi:AcrR family transcriptional regulator
MCGGVMAEDRKPRLARSDTAAAIPAGGPGAGRAGLDQRRILGAAVQFIDENGLRALTMQRLGAYLGVEGLAPYR